MLPPLLEQAFSLVPCLLLDLTGHDWRFRKDTGQTDRQTESWCQVCCMLCWRHTTLIASFLYLDS
jgi:hypothetical protein